MGLRYPEDLARWSAWQERRHTLRLLKSRLRPGRPAEPPIHLRRSTGGPPSVLVVLESGSPTERAALLEPLALLVGEVPFALAAPGPLALPEAVEAASGPWSPSREGDLRALAAHTPVVMSLGHFLPLSRIVFDTRGPERPLTVVQHGLLTPATPPLPRGSLLLAWSQADGAFWRSGRADVTAHVVGSQLLHNAAAAGTATHVSRFLPPLFLGQLHAAELSRSELVLATTRFCRQHDAAYRPHPSERDRLSRMQHRLWERIGIEVIRTDSPLAQAGRPIVSVFSTGVLEAAATGLPSWVYHPNPPSWLTEFWDRYGMHQWGTTPTPPPPPAARAPARLVADALRHQL